MKKILSFLLVVVIILGLCSCSSKIPATAEDIYYALESAGFPVHSLTVLDSETDPNDLLGRPGQYTSKVIFFDISGNANKNNDECTIEVFESKNDAQKRYEYVKSLSESIAMLSEYDYLNGIALLRIDNCVTPDEAQKYEEWFMTQDFSDFSEEEKVEKTSDNEITEPSADTFEIQMPMHLMLDDEIALFKEKAMNGSSDPDEMTVRLEDDVFYITMSKEQYNKTLTKDSFIQTCSKELSSFSCFRSIDFSDDFLTANVTIDRADYSANNQYGVILLSYRFVTNYNAFFGNFEPYITVNLFEEGSETPFYSFFHKRPAEKIIEVSAGDLANAFLDDEQAAREKYVGKYVLVTGNFQYIEDTGSFTYILVEPKGTSNSSQWIQGNVLDYYHEGSNAFKEGREVTILGRCSGYDMFVIVDDCVIF